MTPGNIYGYDAMFVNCWEVVLQVALFDQQGADQRVSN